jgi:hypothetical protein
MSAVATSAARPDFETRPGDAERRAASLRAQRSRHASKRRLAALVRERPYTPVGFAGGLSRRGFCMLRGGTVWTPAARPNLLCRLEDQS